MKTRFPRSNVRCPVTLDIFFKPVTLGCGHSFEGEALQAHIKEHNNGCPYCRAPIELEKSYFNKSLRSEIKQYLSMPEHADERDDQYSSFEVIADLMKKRAQSDTVINAIARYLIQKNDIDRFDSHGNTLLHIAVFSHKVSVVKYLLNQDHMDINRKNNLSHTPLMIAVSRGFDEIVKCLSEHPKIDPDVPDFKQETAFDYTSRLHYLQYLLPMSRLSIKNKEKIINHYIKMAPRREEVIYFYESLKQSASLNLSTVQFYQIEKCVMQYLNPKPTLITWLSLFVAGKSAECYNEFSVIKHS